ncbi:hypothetical protein E5163_05050 [Marinicauda algicola]|uniref:Uncharacterized protein n=1 Tax=Marinicauda algicola TaxID=2029849 RepID=A0A4V3RYI1_9PROT|nr:hypothetical protein [Marinicauda algicola]TGY90489.1 hypothetical protein E5163_05050 [Marinicauda algicola]
MIGVLCGLIRSLARFLAKPQIPLWIHIFGYGLTVFLTLWLSPNIQKTFEGERVRSEYVINQFEKLSADTHETLRLVRVYSDGEFPLEQRRDARRRLLEILTSLNWRAVELSVIVGSEEELVISSYQNAVINMIQSIESENESEFVEAYHQFNLQSMELMNALSRHANLDRISREFLEQQAASQ